MISPDGTSNSDKYPIKLVNRPAKAKANFKYVQVHVQVPAESKRERGIS